MWCGVVCVRGEGRKEGRGEREEGGKKRIEKAITRLQQWDTDENDEVASLTNPHVAVVEEELVQYTAPSTPWRALHQCHRDETTKGS